MAQMNLSRLIPVLPFFLATALTLRAEMADGIMAVVNATSITYAEVEDFAAPALQSLRRQYADQPDVYRQKYAETLNDSLDQLIERQLILHSFEVDGYVMPDGVVDQLVHDRIRDRFGDRASLIKTLQAQGITFEQFRKQLRDQYIESAMRNLNVQKSIVISPYKVQNYYAAHQDDYKQEDQVKLRMIVLNKSGATDPTTLSLAREIQAKIKEGASFQEMASIYSQGSQQHQGGDWGWVERSVLRKELADVAFGLNRGQVSDVLETADTCYLMLVEDKKPAQYRPLTDVRKDIEKILTAQEQATLQKNWMATLKKKNFVIRFTNTRTEY